MLKDLSAAPTVNVQWQGETVASVRGLSPADLTALLLAAGEEIGGLVKATEE